VRGLSEVTTTTSALGGNLTHLRALRAIDRLHNQIQITFPEIKVALLVTSFPNYPAYEHNPITLISCVAICTFPSVLAPLETVAAVRRLTANPPNVKRPTAASKFARLT